MIGKIFELIGKGIGLLMRGLFMAIKALAHGLFDFVKHAVSYMKTPEYRIKHNRAMQRQKLYRSHGFSPKTARIFSAFDELHDIHEEKKAEKAETTDTI